MHKVAVLLDGGFVIWELSKRIRRRPQPLDMYKLGVGCYAKEDEDLFRVYYYDCDPYAGVVQHPITGEEIDFGKTKQYRYRSKLYADLSRMDKIAFRRGVLKHREWKIKRRDLAEIIENKLPYEKWKIVPNFNQKGVDIKIGLDIAWLSSKRIVDRIALFTGDTDFVPAMKFARREGVQVVLIVFEGANVHTDLMEHADEVRPIAPKACGIEPATPKSQE